MGHWQTKVEIQGLDAVLELLRRQGSVDSLIIETHHKATATRSAAENAKIAALQRNAGRNPFFISAAELKRLSTLFRDALGAAAVRGPREVLKAAQKAARQILEAYREHVRAGRSRRGGMRPLAKSTTIRKAKTHGRQPPILEDTGELLQSLAFRIRVMP